MKALGASHITILFHDYAWHRFYIIDCAAHYNYISYAIPVTAWALFEWPLRGVVEGFQLSFHFGQF